MEDVIPPAAIYKSGYRVNETKTLAENNTYKPKQIRVIRRRKQDYKFKVKRIFQKDRTIRRACLMAK